MRSRYGSSMKLQELLETFAICRLAPNEGIPSWVNESHFFSITKTARELSVVCEQSTIPPEIKAEKNWKAFRVIGTLDFSLTGILASIANPLAKEKVSIFAISTFDTDFVLVKSSDLLKARQALQKANFTFI